MNVRRLSLDTTLTPERMADLRAGRPTGHAAAQDQVRRAGLGRRQGGRSYRPDMLYADPRTISPRWSYAVMRIKRILEGHARASTVEGAIKGAECAGLAQQYIETWSYYMFRSKPVPLVGTDHNPFRHLSDGDAIRKFVRMVEDICDRSTGKLGSWYTR